MTAKRAGGRISRHAWDELFKSSDPLQLAGWLDNPLSKQIFSTLEKHLSPGSSMLEVGSGTGQISGYLAKKGYNVTLLDFSKVALLLGKQVFGTVQATGHHVSGELFSLPFKNDSFDCVWNSGVMEHFSESEFVTGLQEMARVSKDKIAVIVPNAGGIFYRLAKFNLERRGEWLYGDEYPRFSLRPLLTRAKLGLLEEKFLDPEESIQWAKQIPTVTQDLLNVISDWYGTQANRKFWDPILSYLLMAVASKKSTSIPSTSVDSAAGDSMEQVSFALEQLSHKLSTQMNSIEERYRGDLQAKDKQLEEVHEHARVLMEQNEAKDKQLEEVHERNESLRLALASANEQIKGLEQSSHEFVKRINSLEASSNSLQGQLREKQQILDSVNALARKLLPGFVRTLGNRAIARATQTKQRSELDRLKPAMLSEPLVPEKGLSNLFPGKYDVLLFPIIDFDFVYVQRPQHLARRFAREGHRVFYLRTGFQISKTWNPPVVKQVERNIYQVQLLSPRAINLYSDEIDETSLDWFRSQLDWLEINYAIVDSVCLVELPFWTTLVKGLQEIHEWKVIYDCLDYVGGFSNVSMKVFDQEETLVRSADLVLASSKTLFERISTNARKCLLLKNACEYDIFAAGGATPSELESVKRPIVGYYGSISEWFDVGLVAETARAHPDKTFVLIGQVWNADISSLKGLENVHLLGPRPYETLPAYLEVFDICFIPFRRTELTAATNPVKVYEMLSAGKPIVAVDLPELHELGDLIYLATERNDFVSKIDLALKEKDRDNIVSKRKQYALANTWDERFAKLLSEITSLYDPASIVIVTYNNQELTRACIDSIFESTTYPSFEVIVVDNGSIDGTAQMLAHKAENHSNLRVFFNAENKGFASAVNAGLKECKGRYLFVLNNDVVVTRGSLSGLIRHLEHDATIGLICPVTNSAANEVSLHLPSPLSQRWIFDFALMTRFESRGSRFPIRTVPLFFAGTTRSVVEDVGVLDERFEIGMFEDDDWSHRMRLHGYQTLCAEDVFAFHAGRASFSLLGEGKYIQVFDANKERFESKWSTIWLGYSKRGLDLGKSRDAIKTAARELGLLLRENPGRPVVIFPPTIGWSVPLFQRPHHLAKKLAEMGFLVFFSVDDSRFDLIQGFEKIEERLYKSNIPHEAYIQVDKPIVFTTCYNRQYLEYYRRPIVIYDYYDDLTAFPHDQRVLGKQHQWLVTHADLVIVSADTLLEEVQEIRQDAVLCPNAVEFSDFTNADTKEVPLDIRNIRDEGKPIIGYIGAISKWLDYGLLTRAVDLNSEMNFVLIGYELDDSARKTDLFRRKNVRFLGPRQYVEIPRYLNGMDVAIIPFRTDRIGATTSPLKLFEYLAAGKPVVTTDMRECAKYSEVLVSRGYREFAANIKKALKQSKEPLFRERLRKIAESNTWEMRASTIVEGLAKKRKLETIRPAAREISLREPA